MRCFCKDISFGRKFGKVDFFFKTQKDFLDYLPELGFPVNPHIKIGKGLKFLKEYINQNQHSKTKLLTPMVELLIIQAKLKNEYLIIICKKN